MKKVILVDGNNLLFRSYYATAYNGVIMRNSKGFPTNALYGFINMMNKIVQEERPSYIMVAFDKGKTFRHDQYLEYKAGRSETPDELKQQFPKAKEVLDAMGIFHFEIDNYEADDIIGTLAKMIDLEEDFVGTIVSSDKDLLQLISKDVDVKLLKQTGFIRMNEQEFRNTYGGLEPIRMIDLKSLMGDASDHIPGVKGIGEKTAIQLLNDYRTLDGIYQNIDSIKGKLQEKLKADKQNAYMSYDLATIYRNVPLSFGLNDLLYRGLNLEEYVKILEELEFHSILKKLDLSTLQIPVETKKESDFEIEEITLVDDLSTFHIDKDYAYFLEMIGTNYHHAKILGMGIYDGNKSYYIPFEVLKTNPNFLSSHNIKYTYDVKKQFVALHYHGIDVKNTTFDMMIATYLLDYTVKEDIAFVAEQLNASIPFYEDTYGTEKRPKQVEEETVQKMACQKAKFIYKTKDRLLEELKQEEELSLFEDIEMPLSMVLADMELTGIRVDQHYLEQMGDELKEQIDSLAEEIYKSAGITFNIMSPKQLGEVLFDHLAIPYPKKIKNNNYSTSKDILDKIVFVHPIVEQILKYRTLMKLYTNYALGLVAEIKEDGRIHTVYNQTLTRTGRLSSVKPNLQNIPARLEYGRLIRKAFVASPGCLLLSSDYSQIELRMFAHMSSAKNLIQAFQEEKDIHSQTAADIFHVPLKEVTPTMRRTAKAVNFGILYGISSFGLSEDLNINVKDAKNFIKTYLKTYPGIQEYMDLEIKEAYQNGYVKTIMNRRRTIEELKNKNYMIRSQGERMALNTPIQGSSADILKKAMVEIYEEFQKRNLQSKMLLQVHDELIFDVLEKEKDEVEKIVRNIMEHVVTLKVPLKVEIATGSNWYEAK